MHIKIKIPLTLTLTLESALRFQKLRLGFENSSQLLYLSRFTFYIWNTHNFGQSLSMHIKMFIPVTLTLTPDSVLRFRNLFRFQKSSQLVPFDVYLLYLAHTYLGTRLFHARKNCIPVTLTLTQECV